MRKTFFVGLILPYAPNNAIRIITNPAIICTACRPEITYTKDSDGLPTKYTLLAINCCHPMYCPIRNPRPNTNVNHNPNFCFAMLDFLDCK